jgi:hypothetical protein
LETSLAKDQCCSLSKDQPAILADSPLPATALAKERDATIRMQDATASATMALAEDKQPKEDKRCQEEAAAEQHRAGVNLHLFALAYSYE